MVVPMEGTQGFLRSLNELASYLGVHMKHKKTKPSFESANQKLANVYYFFFNHRKKAKALQNISKNCTNGPEGTVSAATISSVQLLQKGLLNIEQWIQELSLLQKILK